LILGTAVYNLFFIPFVMMQMAIIKLLFLSFLKLLQGLKLQEHSTSKVEPKFSAGRTSTVSSAACPIMPMDYSVWDDKNAYYFGIIIDGKDCEKGPHVYDWDHNFFPTVFKALQQVYADDNVGPPDMNTIMMIREAAIPQWSFKEGGASGEDFHPECSNKMSCNERNAILEGMWTELYTSDNNISCPREISIMKNSAANLRKKLLIKLLQEYKNELLVVISPHEKLSALARMSKTFMWIHPFEEGNGRVHSVLLQREVRRLELVCGLLMFNQNKDAFADTISGLSSKLAEGLRMFDKGLTSGRNPWLDPVNVDLHFAEHQLPDSLNSCMARKKFGSGGTIGLAAEK